MCFGFGLLFIISGCVRFNWCSMQADFTVPFLRISNLPHISSSRSQDRLLLDHPVDYDDDDFGLSSTSALNGRYFGDTKSSRGTGKGGNKSRSLDNLLGQEVVNSAYNVHFRAVPICLVYLDFW